MDISDWYKTIPIFTKYWLTGTMGLSILARFGLLAPQWLILHSYSVFNDYQLWRIVTSLFFYPLTPQTGFHFMLNCFFLYNYSKRLEQDHFRNIPSDYFVLLVFNWFCCVVAGLFFDLYYLMDPMVLSVLYIWCQLNKDVIVNFWFGTRFKAMYLPWVLLLINLVLSGGGFDSLLGILVGHLYFFLKFKYPQELGGPNLMVTPSFLKNYFPDVSGGVYGFGASHSIQRPATRQTAGGTAARNPWGQGNILGNN